MAEAALVGEPVVVTGGLAPGTQGPYFSAEAMKSIMETHEWSDGFCDFSDNMENFALSLFCSCISLYHILDAGGEVEAFGSLKIDKGRYLCAYLAFLVVSYFVRDMGPHIKIPVHGQAFTLGEIACIMVHSGIIFTVLRGMRDKYQVKEDDGMTAMKSLCCPQFCCLCPAVWGISQVARHVYRVQGYYPIPNTHHAAVAPAGQAAEGQPVPAQGVVTGVVDNNPEK